MILMDVNVKLDITNSWRTSINLSLTKSEYFTILDSDILILWKLSPTLPGGMFKCQISQLYFPVDFSDLMPLEL
jgi:hypothetical protein